MFWRLTHTHNMQQPAYYCDSPKPVAIFNVTVAHRIACPNKIRKQEKVNVKEADKMKLC